LANIDKVIFSAGVSVAGCVVTGLNDVNTELQYAIYPNPTTSNVQLLGVGEWKIVNQAGQLLQSGKKETEVDLSGYPDGVYYLITKDKTHKIVKR
jgi:hypothetical protein